MLKSILPSYDNSLKKQLRIDAAFSAAAAAVISFVVFLLGKSYLPVLQAIYFFCIVMFALLFLEPHSLLFKRTVSRDKLTLALAVCAFVATVLVCVIPMNLNPTWSGKAETYRNEYEELADALLNGHLNVNSDADVSGLLAMENPYDASARYEQGVAYEWDHAFYNGKYYVYFGVVPAILLFVPFKYITGITLKTWVATAIFSTFIVAAIFLLGYKIATKLKSKMPLGVYAVLSSCLSFVILWYAIKRPILYCTAITSGLCFALWCIYFAVDAFYIKDTPPVWETVTCALCGALVFGCRPPIGLSEIVVLPFILRYISRDFIRGNKKKDVLIRAIAFAVPYIIIAALLMLYNYARFENPFEFGQSYQLTVTDQTSYSGNFLERFSTANSINWCVDYLFDFANLQQTFPWLTGEMGIMLLFPVLWLGFRPWRSDEKCVKWFHALIYFAAIIIIAGQTLSSPYILSRYCMDFVFLICVATLFYVAFKYNGNICKTNEIDIGPLLINSISVISIIATFLLFFVYGDASIVETDFELADKLSHFFALCSLQ